MLPDSIFGLRINDEGAYGFAGLPMLYRVSYDGRFARIGGTPCVIVAPKGPLKPLQVEKLSQEIFERESLPCLVHAEGATAYQRKSMTERGVAWISSEHTFSIPFLVASCDARELRRKSARPLTANAQRLAVRAIAGLVIGQTTTEVARTLGVSLSSAANYFAELDAACPGLVGTRGRARFVQVPEGRTREGLYDALRPHLTSPVRKRVFLKVAESEVEAMMGLPLSGVSALSQYTELSDDPWRTCALFGSDVKGVFPDSIVVGEYDQPDVLIELWRYEPWERDGMVDAVSLRLALDDWDRSRDERLEDVIDRFVREAFM